MYHITPIENLEQILSTGLYPAMHDEGFGVFVADKPINCYVLMFERFVKGNIFAVMKNYALCGIVPEIKERIYALLEVDTTGYELKETYQTARFGEAYYSGHIPADRITYIGNINTAERSLLLANAKLNLDTLGVLEKW